ncbi:hypothetical protein LCGC14_1385620 [marine sediment metagenome]|uniref:Uncharacterized protein n=1 Tax=marine sediment metagenome TaxID=412755 RepID=A0A0F9N302_9ZZZZ
MMEPTEQKVEIAESGSGITVWVGRSRVDISSWPLWNLRWRARRTVVRLRRRVQRQQGRAQVIRELRQEFNG